jgi:hypothetical protein
VWKVDIDATTNMRARITHGGQRDLTLRSLSSPPP